LAVLLGWLGRVVVLGCYRKRSKRPAAQADQARKKKGRRQTFAGWAQSRTELNGGKGLSI
jgi:hypothetical protein